MTSIPITPSGAAGANVRAEMARKVMTQTALARHLGFSQVALSARLRGVTPFDVNELARCAEVLGVPLDRLLDGVGSREPVTEKAGA